MRPAITLLPFRQLLGRRTDRRAIQRRREAHPDDVARSPLPRAPSGLAAWAYVPGGRYVSLALAAFSSTDGKSSGATS
jgi:hypothetical protein